MLRTLFLLALLALVLCLREWSNRKMFGDIETKRQRGKENFKY